MLDSAVSAFPGVPLSCLEQDGPLMPGKLSLFAASLKPQVDHLLGRLVPSLYFPFQRLCYACSVVFWLVSWGGWEELKPSHSPLALELFLRKPWCRQIINLGSQTSLRHGQQGQGGQPRSSSWSLVWPPVSCPSQAPRQPRLSLTTSASV